MTDSIKAKTLKAKTFSAIFWSLIEIGGLRIITFVIGIILARLLLPEQFGLIAMLSIFMVLGNTLLDSGFGAALIQKSNPTKTDECSIFYFNIIVGLVVYLILYISAPGIANFYNQPMLKSLTRVLSLIIIINSFGLIQNTKLMKSINFKSLAKVNLTAGLLSGLFGVTCAYKGFGVWSLVVQQISRSFFRTVIVWLINNWRPKLIFSITALSEMFAFSSKMLASGILNTVFDNIHLLIIGKVFSATDLGYYSRAKNLAELPSLTFSGMVGRVFFPVFALLQNEPERLKNAARKALVTLVMVNFPLMIGLAVTAKPLVLLLLTEKWLNCVPYFQLLCIVWMVYPLHLINLQLLMAVGRSDLFFRLEVIKKVLIVVNILITIKYGIIPLIYGMIVVTLLSYFLNSYYNGNLINYSFIQQLMDLWPYVTTSVIMGILVYAIGFLRFPNNFFQLSVQIASGMIFYGTICWILKLKIFIENWYTILERFRIKRSIGF